MNNTKRVGRNRLETYFDTTDPNILGWYEFDQSTGTIVDLVGNAGDIDITGIVEVIDDSIGTASKFSGSGVYGTITSPSTALAEATQNAQTQGMALSMWVKATAKQTNRAVVSQLDGAGTGRNWITMFQTGGATGDEIATDLGGTTFYTGVEPVLGQYYHIVVNYNPVVAPDTYGKLAIWVNGSIPGNLTPQQRDINEGADGNFKFTVDKAGGSSYNGYVHQCLIYDRGLLDAEIEALYNKGVVQFQGGFGVTEVSGVTAGKVGDTPFQVSSGTFNIAEETIDNQRVKAITCTAPGVLYAPVQALGVQTQEAAWGTYEWWWWKDNTANVTDFVFASDTIGTAETAGQDGYTVRIDSDESLKCIESNAGTPSELYASAADYMGLQTWYGMKVTRAPGGETTIYRRGTGNGNDYTQLNQFTDNTIKLSDYVCMDMDAGDKIAYGGINSRYSITKNLTVK